VGLPRLGKYRDVIVALTSPSDRVILQVSIGVASSVIGAIGLAV